MSVDSTTEWMVESGGVTNTVVAAVADANGVEPTDLQPPLYDVIDPDALEQIFARNGGDVRHASRRLSFTMAGCEVVVHGDGRVVVTAADEERSPASSAVTHE